MLERHIQKRQVPKVYAVVGDGFSEKIYFEKMKAAERLRNITIKPELPNRSGKGGGFVRVFKKAEELHRQGYDRVYCLIDFDTVLSENKVSSNYHRHRRQPHLPALATGINNSCFTDIKRIGPVRSYWPARIPVLYLRQYLSIQLFNIRDFAVPDLFAVFIGKGSIAKFPAQEIVD